MPVLTKNPYAKTNWRDHIVDIETGQVIQEGTRFTQARANNIEEGIYNAYGWLVAYQDEIQKLRIQLEMVGRSPINNGTFLDPLSEQDTKALTLQNEVAVVQLAYEAGTTLIQLDKVPFTVGTFVTIYDDEQSESIQVTAVDVEAKTITVAPLQNSYKKGAVVARTNVGIDEMAQEMIYGEWGNYSVEISEVI